MSDEPVTKPKRARRAPVREDAITLLLPRSLVMAYAGRARCNDRSLLAELQFALKRDLAREFALNRDLALACADDGGDAR